MAELSVIIPFVNEYPQILWTIRSISEELEDRVDYEIIAVNNYCEQQADRPEDKGYENLKNVEPGNKWLKVLHYKDKLSHWNAKRYGVSNSTGKFLFFSDAHCSVARDALTKAFDLYEFSHKALHGTLHLPLTYKILEWRKLIYKLVADQRIGNLHYKFSSYRDSAIPYEVPCMSTCGMLMSRAIYDDMDGWPPELGIYGGGENYSNFVLAILGYRKFIMPGRPLYHHGDRRGYSANSADSLSNRMIANYMFGGKKWLDLMMLNSVKARPNVKAKIYNRILQECVERRLKLKEKQKITIEEWINKWNT